MDRRIAHLDMDAFYASVELLRYPELRGQAVVVGGRRRRAADDSQSSFMRLSDYVGRGVATTATYEARTVGVHSAMGLMKAAKLAPDAILLPADFEEYGRMSRLFKAAVAEIAPTIEDRGIDEIYIDLTDVPGETVALAKRIKDNVRRATQLTCSIGIAPNKLLAKLASEMQKPDGLTALDHADVPAKIWPLAASKVNGIGPRANEKLAAINIRTIGDLATFAEEKLIAHFGNHYGHWLAQVAHGHDDRPVVTAREPKSISRETTFERDLHAKRDRDQLSRILLDLCERLSGDLARKGYLAKSVGVKLRFADFKIVTRDVTLTEATADTQAIRAAARSCLRRVAFDRRLRLLGVKAAALHTEHECREREAAETAPLALELDFGE
jgi:DNA polymerase IV